MKHAMIDVEALRLKKPWIAPLMQIGIVIFDEKANVIQGYEIYLNQYELPGWAEPEQGTLEWWKGQDKWVELNRRIDEYGVDAHEAMVLLNNIYKESGCETAWFAGPQYDQVMLESYFDHFGIPYPWRYNDSRDFRTIRKQHKDVLEDFPDNPNMHLAMDDCLHQVARLRAITEKKGIEWF